MRKKDAEFFAGKQRMKVTGKVIALAVTEREVRIE